MADKTVLKGGTVVGVGAARADIVIEGGLIRSIEAEAETMDATVIDVSNLLIMPGAIDSHVHFWARAADHDPGDLDKQEGFATGTSAAAAGGITTVVDMPQGFPLVHDERTFRIRRGIAEEEAVVDFGLWGAILPNSDEASLQAQIDAGVVGLKARMCTTDPTFPAISDAQLRSALEGLRGQGVPVAVHAENDSLIHDGIARMRGAGRTDPLAHADSRPTIVEVEAVERAVLLAEDVGGWVHIVHLSSPEAAAKVASARERGVHVTCETCPQYLLMDLNDLERLGPRAKCAPALRTRDQKERLWDYVRNGTVSYIASDHCGFTDESKTRGESDIFEAPAGLPGTQTMLTLFADEASRRGISWPEIARLTSTEPARLLHLPGKGAIEVGNDADLVVLDPRADWTVDSDRLLDRNKWSPYVGRSVSVQAVATLVRGTVVFDARVDEPIAVQAGHGEFVISRLDRS
jgi:allantoinase